MTSSQKILAVSVIILLIIVGGMFALIAGSDDEQQQTAPGQTTTSEQQATQAPPSNGEAGQYVTYYEGLNLADIDADTRVLFFKADWCITCNALDKDIRENQANIPGDMAIISVDYDSETDLRRRYDIRQQHTLVQIDSDGNRLDTWLLSPSLDAIVNRVQGS